MEQFRKLNQTQIAHRLKRNNRRLQELRKHLMQSGEESTTSSVSKNVTAAKGKAIPSNNYNKQGRRHPHPISYVLLSERDVLFNLLNNNPRKKV